MILNHVAKRAGFVVVRGPAFNPKRFRDCDLNIVDMVAIPKAFKNRIGKSKNEQVLYGLFAEVMVDAVYLRLVEVFVKQPVQLPRRLEIVSKGFLDDDSGPA